MGMDMNRGQMAENDHRHFPFYYKLLKGRNVLEILCG